MPQTEPNPSVTLNASIARIGITAHQIMVTLFHCMGQGKSHYSRASRHRINALLSQFHHKDIGLRWQSRCIKKLIDLELITRQLRYRHDDSGLIRQIPSNFAFTLDGAAYLARNSITLAQDLVDAIKNWIKKKDRRWPSADFQDRDRFRKLYPAELKRLKRQPAI